MHNYSLFEWNVCVFPPPFPIFLVICLIFFSFIYFLFSQRPERDQIMLSFNSSSDGVFNWLIACCISSVPARWINNRNGTPWIVSIVMNETLQIKHCSSIGIILLRSALLDCINNLMRLLIISCWWWGGGGSFSTGYRFLMTDKMAADQVSTCFVVEFLGRNHGEIGWREAETQRNPQRCLMNSHRNFGRLSRNGKVLRRNLVGKVSARKSKWIKQTR